MFNKEEELEKATMLINAQHCVGIYNNMWVTNATPKEIFLKGVEYAKNNPELISDKIVTFNAEHVINDKELFYLSSHLNKDDILKTIELKLKETILEHLKKYIKIEVDKFVTNQLNQTYRASIRVVKNN